MELYTFARKPHQCAAPGCSKWFSTKVDTNIEVGGAFGSDSQLSYRMLIT